MANNAVERLTLSRGVFRLPKVCRVFVTVCAPRNLVSKRISEMGSSGRTEIPTTPARSVGVTGAAIIVNSGVLIKTRGNDIVKMNGVAATAVGCQHLGD